MNLIPYFGEGFSSNSYLLISGEDAVLIDCSVPSAKVIAELEKYSATLKYIILTHGHFDHIETLDEMREAIGAKVVIHENDAEMLTDGIKNGYCTFFAGDFTAKATDKTVSDGDIITVGDTQLKVIHTPGHSKGSTCYRCGDMLFTCDTLFANNIGRSDLYGGDGATLYAYLRKLSTLRAFKADGEISVYPGHGPLTTLEREIKYNYYIRDALSLL